ncbi:MAG: outer membrane protein assembly factor BamD, partial [Planctomycetota bacterium]
EGFKKVKAPDPNTPEGELHAVRQLIAAQKGKEAVKAGEEWIKAYPNHPLLADAYILRGDAHTLNNDYYKALFDYEYVARAYPGSDQFNAALERELKIAQTFGTGVKRRLWGMRLITAYSESEELLIRIQERAPGSKIAERAGIELANQYYTRSEMENAAEAYDLFLQNFPKSQWAELAMQRQVLANIATFKGPRFDATGLVEAQRRLLEYKNAFPAAAEQIGADALLTRIDETLATRSLLVAQWYETKKDKVSAIFMYKRVIRDHAGSAAAQKALEALAKLDPQSRDIDPLQKLQDQATTPHGPTAKAPESDQPNTQD